MNSNIKLILKYLKDRDCIESFLTLQRQTGISLTLYSKELEFFKKIMLKGDFNQAINFILTFENRIDDRDLKKIVMDVYRQKLYELIENPNEEELKKIFEKELINYCSQDDFQELFNYLMYRSVNEIQGLEKWTVLKGRYQCFEAVIPYLEMFNSVLKTDQVQEKLQTIIEYYFANINKQAKRETDYFKDTFQKNKSSLNSNKYQLTIDEELQKKNVAKRESESEKEKQTIRNSIMNMNLSGNYSQIKNKMGNSIQQNTSIKSNYQEPIDNKSEKVTFPEKVIIADKPSALDKNPSSFNPSSVSDRRPRVNASLNGPMNRDKIDSSVKIDNFLRNDPPSQENIPAPTKYSKTSDRLSNSSQLSQPNSISSPSILNSYSQMAKSKRESPPTYSNKQENPIQLSHLNDLESSQLNEISEEDQSQMAKSDKMERPKDVKPSYIFNSKNQDQQLEEEIKRNIQYLQQASSVIYKSKDDFQKEKFTFSNQQEEKSLDKIKKVVKLASITDSKAIRTCQFSQSGNFFALGTNSSVLKIFDVVKLFEKNKYQDLTPIYQIDGLHQKSIFCLDWSKNERSLITCSNDLHIKLTEISKGFTDHKTTVIGKHQSCIRMVKFNSQENRIVSCGDDSVIKVWDIGKVKRSMNLKNHTNSVSAIKLQNDNELYSVSKDMTIKKWDLRSNQNVATSKVQESQLTYIANNTDKIIVSHKDGTVSFFNYGLQLEHSVQIHEEEIRSIEALRGDGTLLTASFDGHVALFSERNSHSPNYFQHNDANQDKVVFATFLHSTQFRGFSSTSTLGLCHIYSYE